MDVYCLERREFGPWDPSAIAQEIQRAGSATLGRHARVEKISSLRTFDKKHFNCTPLHNNDALYILGDRESIVSWLTLQGTEPAQLGAILRRIFGRTG